MSKFLECILFLDALGVMPVTTPSLKPIQRALRRTGLIDNIRPEKNIVIAGTNGKGTVAATLSALLHCAVRPKGEKVGLFTSPHLVSALERIRISEKDISMELFVEAFDAVKETIILEKLSHFEALSLMAAWIFFENKTTKVDWGIWEVGMGGQWDATNAIPHNFCSITQLGKDHENFLGTTLTDIALQKFGIIQPRCRVVYSPMDRALTPLREQVQNKTECRWIPAKECRYQSPQKLISPWGEANLVLLGERAAQNTANALTLFEVLGFEPEAHLSSLQKVRWPGRFQQVFLKNISCPVYLSGDHNVDGIQSLLKILKEITWNKMHLVVGVANDKDVDRMLSLLSEVPRSELSLTETPFKTLPLASYPNRWKKIARHQSVQIFDVLEKIGQEALPNDVVVITGSLYLVGDVLAKINN